MSLFANGNFLIFLVTLPPCNSETYGWWDYIDVSFNALSGPLNLMAIGCLDYFIASNNPFSGPMNLLSMPGYLADVSNNAFSGAFSLPSGMWYFRDQLNISGNNGLCGMAKTLLPCPSIVAPAKCTTQSIGNGACVVNCPKCP